MTTRGICFNGIISAHTQVKCVPRLLMVLTLPVKWGCIVCKVGVSDFSYLLLFPAPPWSAESALFSKTSTVFPCSSSRTVLASTSWGTTNMNDDPIKYIFGMFVEWNLERKYPQIGLESLVQSSMMTLYSLTRLFLFLWHRKKKNQRKSEIPWGCVWSPVYQLGGNGSCPLSKWWWRHEEHHSAERAARSPHPRAVLSPGPAHPQHSPCLRISQGHIIASFYVWQFCV